MNLCPKCGSGKLENQGSALEVDPPQKCISCGWAGKSSETLAADTAMLHINTIEPDQALNIVQALSENFFKLLFTQISTPVGRAIIDGGLVSLNQPTELAALIRAGVHGAHTAILRELEQIQSKVQNGRSE